MQPSPQEAEVYACILSLNPATVNTFCGPVWQKTQASHDAHRAETVIVVQIAVQDMPQVRLTEDHEVVQALSFHPLDPGLGEGVEIGTQGWNGPKLDAFRLQGSNRIWP